MHCIKFTRLIRAVKGYYDDFQFFLEVYDFFAVGLNFVGPICANIHRDISFTEFVSKTKEKSSFLLRC